MAMTNSELWAYARSFSPSFESHTASLTYETFKDAGFSSFDYSSQILSEWFEVMLMPVLQQINVSHAQDYLANKGVGEVYDTPNGGITQRLAVASVKPINPQYLNISNGSTYSPFVVRKQGIESRFYKQNFDYSSTITLQDVDLKRILASDYGMSEILAGYQEGLRNGYVIQRYENKMAVINAGLNATDDHALKDTQKITLTSWTEGEPTDEEVMDFTRAIKNIVDTMQILPQYSGYNAAGYASTQDISRLKLLVRASVWTDAVLARIGLYHPEYLDFDFDIVKVSDFGGLVPYADADYTTPLYPVYDSSLGAQIGWATTENATESEYTDEQVYYKDPNENVLAVLMDKGWIFENIQNGYTVEPIRNPRIMATHYWAHSPHNTIAFDDYYNVITISKPSE